MSDQLPAGHYNWSDRHQRRRQHGQPSRSVATSAQVDSASATRYAELSPAAQDAADHYVQRAVDGITAELRDSATWPEQHRPDGRGWEKLQADAALRLGQLAAAPWNQLSFADAEQAFVWACPTGGGWTSADVVRKWSYQSRRGAPAAVPSGVITAGSGGRVDDQVLEELAGGGAEPPVNGDEQPTLHQRLVHDELRKQRARLEARDLLAAESSVEVALPPLVRLDHFLEVADEPVTHRVDGLWPAGGRVVFSAQKKAGKTTTVGNLIRSLADGVPFLDRFPTGRAQRVVLIDNELDERMLRRWLRDHQVEHAAAVELVALRGRTSTFNILSSAMRSRWAQLLGPADVLVFDCLRPALDALALSEDKEAGRFLEALDELTTEAGIAETIVVHHMGHSSERSRGDSRILDWPDAIWKLVAETEDGSDHPTGPRFFSAYGRDVDQAELQLSFDADHRRLAVTGGSRKQSRAQSVLTEVLSFRASRPGASQRGIEEAVEARREVVREAIRVGVTEESIERRQVGRTFEHYLSSSYALSAPECAPAHGRTGESGCARAPIGAHGAHTSEPDLLEVDAPGAHSCSVCGEAMAVVEDGQTTHPGCEQ